MIHILDIVIDFIYVLYRNAEMNAQSARQQDLAVTLLRAHGMLRLSEFIEAGITAATVSRMEQKGVFLQLARGLYQLPNAQLDAHHALAVAAKLVPNGIICLSSALAFHNLTDKIPVSTWIAIGPKDWRPTITKPRIQVMRHGPKIFDSGHKSHLIEKVPVRVYTPAKTVVDLFYHGRRQKTWYNADVGMNEAIAAMKEALRQKKATPAEIARHAVAAGIWTKVVQPRLEVLTVDA